MNDNVCCIGMVADLCIKDVEINRRDRVRSHHLLQREGQARAISFWALPSWALASWLPPSFIPSWLLVRNQMGHQVKLWTILC